MAHARRWLLGTLAGVLALAALAATTADGSAGDRVPRNVRLADRPVGNLTLAALRPIFQELSQRYAKAQVIVRAPQGGFTASGSQLGLSVDEKATTSALMAARPANPVRRAWRSITSLVRPARVGVVLAVDRHAAHAVVAERDPGPRIPPVEPSITVRGDRLVAVDGEPGRGISPAAVAAKLAGVTTTRGPLVVKVGRTRVEPRFTLHDAKQLLGHAEQLASQSLTVTAAGTTAEVPPATLRRWLRTFPGERSLGVGIDEEATLAGLGELLADANTEPVDAGFVVTGDSVRLTPGRPGRTCCAPEAASDVAAALGSRPPGGATVEVALKPVEPRRTEEHLRGLRVQERVGAFTTSHNPGEPRVHNIHRIADLIRGTVIEPGKSFSVNGHVGPRTAEKGFLEAPVIDEHNKFSESIGGGISQFATTMFNAAFFAGLEIDTYAAHGLYIPRYPYGREATLSFPQPDLVIRNSSPHGVLIWPTYTSTDITVTLYSTKWAEAEQTGQTKTERPARPAPDRDPNAPPLGPCVSVKTERTRRFVADGSTKVDFFYALYRPEEGAECPR